MTRSSWALPWPGKGATVLQKMGGNKPHFPPKFWDPFQATHGFFRRWFVIAYLFSHFVRIGEAAVPGPAEDSFLSHPCWTTPSMPDFCLGVGNPGGIANKHHMFEHFPVGWWHLTETQASKAQQCSFQKSLIVCFGVVWGLLPFVLTQQRQGHARGC